MNWLQETARSLSAPPGDLVYHLIVLFTIEAITVMAWQHRRAAGPRRWFLAAVGLNVGRLALILAAALVALHVIPSIAITPPLERFVEVVSLGLLTWAFVPLLAHYSRVGSIWAVGNLILAAAAYAWLAPQWFVASGTDLGFNGSPQDIVWGAWALALSTLAMVGSLLRRRNGWATSFVAFALMAAGQALHLLSPDRQIHMAEWARWGTLTAYPLFAVLVYTQIVETHEAVAVSASPLPFPTGLPAEKPGVADLWPVAEACRAVAEADDLPLALQQAAHVIAKTLNVDLAAIGVPGKSAGTVEFVAIHHPGAEPQLGTAFLLDSQPTIKHAISHQRPAALEQNTEAMELAALLGSQSPHLMRVEPLVYNRETLGVLILSRVNDDLTSESQVRAAQAACAHLASALGIARKTESLARRADELARSLRENETRDARMRSERAAQITQGQSDLQQAEAQLAEAQKQAAHYQKQAEELAALIDLHMRDQPEAPTPAGWQEQVQQLTFERDQAISEMQNWREEAEQALALQAPLESELQKAQKQIGQIEEELEQAKHALAPVAGDVTAYGLLVSDVHGQVVAASDAAARFLGKNRSALIGQPLACACPDPHWKEIVEELLTMASGSPSTQVPVPFMAQFSGHKLNVELAQLAADGNSSPGGLVAVLTVPGSAEQESENRNEVIASLAQELRTPMTSISGYTDLLLKESAGILGAMQRQFLQRVQANTERMSVMLNDLVRVTAIDTEQFKLEPEPVNIIEIIEEAIMGNASQYRERNVTIQLDLDEHLPPLRADRDSLYQIVSHLLANAGQCSQSGTEVLASAHLAQENFLSVSVTDTGGGIRPADRQRVFSRRYRADNPLIEGLGDTGIGLSIARTLVEAHGGRIWVDSEIGRGSTFTFLFPILPASDEEDLGLTVGPS